MATFIWRVHFTVLFFGGTFIIAAAPQEKHIQVDRASANVVQTISSDQKTQPPLIAPLFIADARTSSVLTLVHDLGVTVGIDVRAYDLKGKSILTFRTDLPPHSQTPLY